MSLLDLFMARHAEIERRLVGTELDFSSFSDLDGRRIALARPAGDLLKTALGLPDRNFSSWLPGIPLAALLAAGRRITADLAPAFLNQHRRNYGLRADALVEFGKAGILLFNIRDFDPTADEDGRRSKAALYEPWTAFLGRLFDEAPESIYFLASLRSRIFDAIPLSRGLSPAAKPSLSVVAGEAGKALAGAAKAAGRLMEDDANAVRAIFRTEITKPIATTWHWAYVAAVNRFVDPDFAGFIASEYSALSDYALTDQPTNATLDRDVGRRFIDFQTRMRYAHLVYSAPLSGSFGGPYGYSLEDDHLFLQAVDRYFRWPEHTDFEYDYFEDNLLDLIQDLQTGILRPKFSQHLSARNWEILRALGTETYARTEPTSYFEHYADPINRAELIGYWQERSDTGLTFAELELQADALLARDTPLEARDLFELADRVQNDRASANALLRRHTEGYQILVTIQDERRRRSSEVAATNPKWANLLMRVMVTLGLQGTETAVGMAGDHARVAYSASRDFRNNAS